MEDNPNKVKKRIQGIDVYNSAILNADFIQSQRITTVILAIENLHPEKKSRVIDLCLEHQITIKQAPPLDEWIKGEVNSNQIRQVKIEDLLQRLPLKISQSHLKGFFDSKIVLVSGAAGSIGGEIVKQLALNNAKKIIILDNAETPIFNLHQNLLDEGISPELLCEEIVSVTDEEGLKGVFEKHRPNIVFHAAALKHVPLMERHPKAAFGTNVIGSRLMAEISGDFGVEKFVMVSTDKAVRPANVMGATKRIAEMYIKALQDSGKYSTKFIITRFGNVLGSNGSVIPTFRRQIEKGGPVKVTHPDITRYFMTIPEACQLVLEAGVMGAGGETYIFDMGEPVKIVDLAKKMIGLSGMRLDIDISIEYSGLRPGEKLYEELWHGDERRLSTHHEKIMIAETSSLDISDISTTIDAFSIQSAWDSENREVAKAIIDFANYSIESEP
ncbi:MAG: polysaccharide biosynthesis protein [Cyclobacteriaceae bacterium]